MPDSPVLIFDPTFPADDANSLLFEHIDSQERFLHWQYDLLLINGQLREIGRQQIKFSYK